MSANWVMHDALEDLAKIVLSPLHPLFTLLTSFYTDVGRSFGFCRENSNMKSNPYCGGAAKSEFIISYWKHFKYPYSPKFNSPPRNHFLQLVSH